MELQASGKTCTSDNTSIESKKEFVSLVPRPSARAIVTRDL